MPKIRVLELYCGIGGMHWALKSTSIPFEIVAAMEINLSVLETYIHNFPDDCAMNRNIQSLTVEELNEMEIDLVAMSPPCQPFCRAGLKLDVKDPRTDSLQHLLSILPQVQFRYILLENVKGFETSEAHDLLIDTLVKCGFHWQEFLLTPTSVDIPNSRLRYYMIGKRKNIPWCFDTAQSIMTEVPMWNSDSVSLDQIPYGDIVKAQNDIWKSRRATRLKLCEDQIENMKQNPNGARCVADILQDSDVSEYSLKPKVIEKYEQAMDIVNEHSTQTCCFTKSYGQYVKGTGSILKLSSGSNSSLRFFTPREISRLLCYPDEFTFPPNISWKQKAKSLGNSINVYVVGILMSLLLK